MVCVPDPFNLGLGISTCTGRKGVWISTFLQLVSLSFQIYPDVGEIFKYSVHQKVKVAFTIFYR